MSALAGPLVDDGTVSEAALPVAQTVMDTIEAGWPADLVQPIGVLRYLVTLGGDQGVASRADQWQRR